MAEQDERAETREARDVLFVSVAELLADCVEGDPASPPVLYADGGVLATLEIIALEPAKLGLLEDVVVGGGGM